jgi:hypothetical protein
MAGAHARTPYHSQSTHGAVISTTTGTAIQNLEKKIQRENPDWLKITLVSEKILISLGVRGYFYKDEDILFEDLPPIYRIRGSYVKGSPHLSAGSLVGLLKLLSLEKNPARPSLNFQNFAIGVFLKCEVWDTAIIHGEICQIPLDKAFACVAFALADEGVYSPQEIEGNFKNLSAQIDETNSPLLACSTGRRHELVGILGSTRYPGILVFADDADFIKQSVELFLKEQFEKLSKEKPGIYQKILAALIQNPLMRLGDFVESTGPTGSADAIDLISSIDPIDATGLTHSSKILNLLFSPSADAGAGAGAGSGAASGSSATTPFPEWIKELRAFVLGRFGEVGLLKTKEDKDLAEIQARAGYEKKLNDFLPESDCEMAQNYLERQSVPLAKAEKLAMLQIGYLFKTYPRSGAVHFIKAQGLAAINVVALGKTASQLSEYLDLLKQMDQLGVIEDEQTGMVSRLKSALSTLRNPTADVELIRLILSPRFSAENGADKESVLELIREKSSGRNGFITNFFASRALLIRDENYDETGVTRLTKYLKEVLSLPSPVTDEWIENYQSTHREGLALTLDPLTINLILLHALRTPVPARTPSFSEALREVIAFIRRSFAETEDEEAGALEQTLKKDSYSEELLALVESGGAMLDLYRMGQEDGAKYSSDLCLAIRSASKAGLNHELERLGIVVTKIKDVNELASVTQELNDADLKDKAKEANLNDKAKVLLQTFLDQTDVSVKIRDSNALWILIVNLGREGLFEEIARTLDQPLMLAKIKTQGAFLSLFKCLKKCRLNHQASSLLIYFVHQLDNILDIRELSSLITLLKKENLNRHARTLLLSFVEQPEESLKEKILNRYQLITLFKLLQSEKKEDEIKRFLHLPSFMKAIQDKDEDEDEDETGEVKLSYLCRLLSQMDFIDEIRALINAPVVLSKFHDINELRHLVQVLKGIEELTKETSRLLLSFASQPTLVNKIQNGYQLLDLFRLLKDAQLSTAIKPILAKPEIFLKIQDGDQLLKLFHFFKDAELLSDAIKPILAKPEIFLKIQDGDQLLKLFHFFKDAELLSDAIKPILALPEIFLKIQNGHQLLELFGLFKDAKLLNNAIKPILALPEIFLKIQDGYQLLELFQLLLRNKNLSSEIKPILARPEIISMVLKQYEDVILSLYRFLTSAGLTESNSDDSDDSDNPDDFDNFDDSDDSDDLDFDDADDSDDSGVKAYEFFQKIKSNSEVFGKGALVFSPAGGGGAGAAAGSGGTKGDDPDDTEEPEVD